MHATKTGIFGTPPASVSLSQASSTGGSFTPKASYRGGWVTVSPKVSIAMSLVMPRKADSFEVSVDDATRISIYSELLSEEMTPKLFDITMTGVSYGLSFSPHSIDLSFSGYGPLLPRLMDKVSDVENKNKYPECSRHVRFVPGEMVAARKESRRLGPGGVT